MNEPTGTILHYRRISESANGNARGPLVGFRTARMHFSARPKSERQNEYVRSFLHVGAKIFTISK